MQPVNRLAGGSSCSVAPADEVALKGGAHMSTKVYYDADADLALLQGRKVAVLGYGSQGHAHALSLRDSGVEVRVGLPASSGSRTAVQEQGLPVVTPAEASQWADTIMVLVPDTAQRQIYAEAI